MEAGTGALDLGPLGPIQMSRATADCSNQDWTSMLGLAKNHVCLCVRVSYVNAYLRARAMLRNAMRCNAMQCFDASHATLVRTS